MVPTDTVKPPSPTNRLKQLNDISIHSVQSFHKALQVMPAAMPYSNISITLSSDVCVSSSGDYCVMAILVKSLCNDVGQQSPWQPLSIKEEYLK